MANAVFIMPKASLLVSAINIVEDIFKEIEKDATEGGHAFQDIQGDVYEMLLSEIATAGKNGQFRTPRHIIKLMAELVAPQLGQRIADPAFRRHWFLHVPTEPVSANGALDWLSLPEADGDKQVLSKGRSRAFLHTLLPEKAGVTVRGGPGKEAWGHPLEATAQYNHTAPGRDKPPICPWRIEVADPGTGSRTLFLHVLEVTDEGVTAPAALKFIAPAGVQLPDGRQVTFNASGPLGGKIGGVALP